MSRTPTDEPFLRGRLGERLAARALECDGWEVLARNWRDGPRELDLVVWRDGVLAFVEVKTRGEGARGHPLDAITARKRRELERAARAWLSLKGRALVPRARTADRRTGLQQVRFDAVVVRLRDGGSPDVSHIPDAWRPGWGGYGS